MLHLRHRAPGILLEIPHDALCLPIIQVQGDARRAAGVLQPLLFKPEGPLSGRPPKWGPKLFGCLVSLETIAWPTAGDEIPQVVRPPA